MPSLDEPWMIVNEARTTAAQSADGSLPEVKLHTFPLRLEITLITDQFCSGHDPGCVKF